MNTAPRGELWREFEAASLNVYRNRRPTMRRTIMTAAVLMLGTFTLGGCVGLAGVLDSAGRDQANVYGSVSTPWGKGKACRSNPQPVAGSTITAKCDEDGMTITVTSPALAGEPRTNAAK